MGKTYIANLADHVGKEVMLNGWVYTKRSSGKIWFLILRDGTGYTQGVISQENVPDEVFDLEPVLTQESSVSLTGLVKEDKRSIGGYELDVSDIKVHQIADKYPITKKEHGTAFLMDNRHLWLRSRKQNAVLKVRAETVRAIRDYFDSNGFVNLDTPIFTANACEGTTTLFETEYFGQKAFLAQSGQLYNEANIMSFGKVYCFGPTFRAEKSKTRRHLTEFWMVEPEIAYCDLDENMDWGEGLICHIVQWALENCREQLEVLDRDTSQLEKIKAPFPRISYTEAVDILNDKGESFEWGGDFGGGDETVISQHFNSPVIVHRFPAAIKAFYMKRDPEDDKLALGMDILAPEGYGEVIGGGERENNHDTLVRRINEHKLPKDSFQWYLDLRKYGTVPHSGFGLGVERTVSWICGISHLREAIPFPRMIHRLEP
ncbi:MAG TPA: asparagine--tRNA ligase [Candidatus Marinimicrobia bacterium]|nr:asparagine--tRNA ligase [Candidatus Neomarinimicrobiota bacterium]HIB70569.1 asparagine--tRNA ligase [Candidatus Neomarinimicrobiota bacterium]HIN62871.1 asparagine--tRNA ligase [Candidatus Neomarinimicrobiota bacterium]HIO36047.1 asparagine--tRNA ligase [Candidatus Neomarinimicrobiota bacterium]HIO74685.1 asparagine--tRNA ligase [Candidatus Neomarinimicrobiota bacterium]